MNWTERRCVCDSQEERKKYLDEIDEYSDSADHQSTCTTNTISMLLSLSVQSCVGVHGTGKPFNKKAPVSPSPEPAPVPVPTSPSSEGSKKRKKIKKLRLTYSELDSQAPGYTPSTCNFSPNNPD